MDDRKLCNHLQGYHSNISDIYNYKPGPKLVFLNTENLLV